MYECPKSNVSELHFESAFSGITELPSFGDVLSDSIKPFLPPKIGEFRNQGKGTYLRQIHLLTLFVNEKETFWHYMYFKFLFL